MNIDFSAIDRAVEKVIAKHDAMFKFEMLVAQSKRECEENPFSWLSGLSRGAVIIAQFKAKINAINGSKIPHDAKVYSIERGNNKVVTDNIIKTFTEDHAIGNPVVICIPD